MNLIDISRQKAEEFFPDETWIEIYRNVYMAAGRKPVNSEREKVFQKEVVMAKIASDNNHVVFLLPEKHYEKKRIPIQSWMDS